VYCFGIVDAAQSPEVLHAFGYTEGTALKGGNNVASILVHTLKSLGWLIPGEPAQRLSIIMDNCAGQNKNKMVLRIALWLVESGYFLTCEFIFYVRGHTKNMCDRMFNLLKKRYREHQVFTMNQLVTNLNMLENVNFQAVLPEIFFDFDDFFDHFYKPFQPNTVKKNHIFLVQHPDVTTMRCKLYDNADEYESFDHRRHSSRPARIADMANYQLKQLTPPGIKPIKQVELWKKWRKFVPRQYWVDICPEPSEEVKAKVAADFSNKRNKRNGTARS